MDLKNDHDRLKVDHESLNETYNKMMVQNQKLIEQLKTFEKESFEIEARIKQTKEAQVEGAQSNRVIQDLKDTERDQKR